MVSCETSVVDWTAGFEAWARRSLRLPAGMVGVAGVAGVDSVNGVAGVDGVASVAGIVSVGGVA